MKDTIQIHGKSDLCPPPPCEIVPMKAPNIMCKPAKQEQQTLLFKMHLWNVRVNKRKRRQCCVTTARIHRRPRYLFSVIRSGLGCGEGRGRPVSVTNFQCPILRGNCWYLYEKASLCMLTSFGKKIVKIGIRVWCIAEGFNDKHVLIYLFFKRRFNEGVINILLSF